MLFQTRILVTHGISFLPKVDLIVTLDKGEISEVGTFQELVTHAGAFAEFLKNYLANELENEENLEADITSIEGRHAKYFLEIQEYQHRIEEIAQGEKLLGIFFWQD